MANSVMKTIVLQQPMRVYTVGRSTECDIVVPEGTVSSRHGTLDFDGRIAFFSDTGSTNGTTIRGEKIQPRTRVPVRPGEVIVLGSAPVRFGIGASGEPTLLLEDAPSSAPAPQAHVERPTQERDDALDRACPRCGAPRGAGTTRCFAAGCDDQTPLAQCPSSSTAALVTGRASAASPTPPVAPARASEVTSPPLVATESASERRTAILRGRLPDVERRIRAAQVSSLFVGHRLYDNATVAEKVRNAARSHPYPGDPRGIFFLYDLTFWGSANNSIVVGEAGISFRFDDGEQGYFIPWKDVDEIWPKGDALIVLTRGWIWTISGPWSNLEPGLFEIFDELAATEVSDLQHLQGPALEALVELLDGGETDEVVATRRVAALIDTYSDILTLVSCDLTQSLADELSFTVSFGSGAAVARPYRVGHVVFEYALALGMKDDARGTEVLDELVTALRQALERWATELPFWCDIAVRAPLVRIARLGLAVLIAPDARESLFRFIERHGDDDQKKQARSELTVAPETVTSAYAALDREQRRVLLATRATPSWPTESFRSVRTATLQALGWQFPLGHPREDTFYVLHPLRDDCYIPMESYSHYVFQERFLELKRLLCALGAVSIDIEATEGLMQEMASASASAVHAEAEGAVSGVAGGRAASESRREQGAQARLLRQSLRLSPAPKREVPGDLLWYSHEPTWQAIARAALEGRVQQYELELALSTEHVLSTALRERLKGELALFGGRVAASVQTDSEKYQRELSQQRVHIVVRFPEVGAVQDAPPRVIDVTPVPSVPALPRGAPTQATAEGARLTDAEAEYLADLHDAYADGEPSTAGRRMLDRRKARLGLSDDVAQRLEQELLSMSRLTDAEREYVEEVQDCWADGVITDDERRILDRRAKRLGIPTERASELEALVCGGRLRAR